MSTTTNVSSSSTSSVMLLNNFCTNFPDSENHLENKEWELISKSRVCAYLGQHKMKVERDRQKTKDGTYLKDGWIAFEQVLDIEKSFRCQVAHAEAQHDSMIPS
jgi:hypothetical protein